MERPTDQELITNYLAKKVNNQPIQVEDIMINEVNIYEHHPHDLADFVNFLSFNLRYLNPGEDEMYFFTPRGRKYPNGSRPSREVRDVGFWKATEVDKAIKLNGETIGRKKSLVFYTRKSIPRVAIQTNWTMDEYLLNVSSKSPNSNDMSWMIVSCAESIRILNNRTKRSKIYEWGGGCEQLGTRIKGKTRVEVG
ncbi:hypothetical protein CASFOL_038292 [Castilleja foliolosa]|uniref:NAC domain-containing protein n=1 Tax=Castilleja foliolosa TaxID=1961234 RepID=A0ABD3BLH1_9LAMI